MMNTDELIASIQTAPEFLHLRREIVELPGRAEPFVPARKILILEQCWFTNGRAGRIESEIRQNPIHYEFVDVASRIGAAQLYKDLASVSFGDVPNLLEFLTMLPEDTTLWLQKANEVNPSMFLWLAEVQAEIEKADLEYLQSVAPAMTAPQNEKGEQVKKKNRGGAGPQMAKGIIQETGQ